MISDCVGGQAFDFSDAETVFLQGAVSFLEIVIPCAICLLIWKMLISNKSDPRKRFLTLGLDSAPTDTPGTNRSDRPLSTSHLLLYFGAAALTFGIGLLVVQACQFLELIPFRRLRPW
jgi:hypothetical protein